MKQDPFEQLGFMPHTAQSSGGDPFASLGFQPSKPDFQAEATQAKSESDYANSPLGFASNFIKGAANKFIEPAIESVKSGINQMGQAQYDSTQGKNPLETGLAYGSGAASAIYSPFAPLISPLMNKVTDTANRVVEPLTNKPSVQRFAQSKAGELTSRVAENVSNAANIFGAVAPVAKFGVRNTLVKQPADAIQKGLDIASNTIQGGVNIAKDISQGYKEYKAGKLQDSISTEVDDLLKKTRSIQNNVRVGLKKNIDYKSYLSEPQVFKGLKVESGKINPDESIATIDNRIDNVMDAKTKMLPFADKYAPEQTREQLRKTAYDNIQGKYTPRMEEAMKTAIDKEVDALPDKMNVSTLDHFRAKFRNSSRNAQGLPLDNEYTALENASRDMVFKATDNLPVDTNGEFAKANTYVKDLIGTKEFLDKTIRNQIVKGGRMTNIVGRLVGATAGTQFGFLGSLVGQEVGGHIADIIVNKQLGSKMKYSMIENLTDNPQVLQQVQHILSTMEEYTPKMLNSGKNKKIFNSTPLVTPAPTTFEPGAQKINIENSVPEQKLLKEGTPGTIPGATIRLPSKTPTGRTQYDPRFLNLSQNKPTITANMTSKTGIDSNIAQDLKKHNRNTLDNVLNTDIKNIPPRFGLSINDINRTSQNSVPQTPSNISSVFANKTTTPQQKQEDKTLQYEKPKPLNMPFPRFNGAQSKTGNKNVVRGVDLTDYSTRPDYTKVITDKANQIEQYIKDSGKSIEQGLGDFMNRYKYDKPITITPKQIIDNATKKGLDVMLVAAMIAYETNFGTKGKGNATNNPFNFGNTDEKTHNTRRFTSLQSAFDQPLTWLQKRKVNNQ